MECAAALDFYFADSVLGYVLSQVGLQGSEVVCGDECELIAANPRCDNVCGAAADRQG